MSMISEQVKELRELAEDCKCENEEDEVVRQLQYAADTIEALSAKLQEANDELNRWHTDHINEKIKNPFAWTSTLVCHNCDHKDEYIEELEVELEELKATNMDNGGGWIACEDRFPPHPKENPIFDGKPLELYLVSVKNTDYAFRAFWNGKFFADGFSKLQNVTAWQPLPEPYRP